MTQSGSTLTFRVLPDNLSSTLRYVLDPPVWSIEAAVHSVHASLC
jgi:hypothetical protein